MPPWLLPSKHDEPLSIIGVPSARVNSGRRSDRVDEHQPTEARSVQHPLLHPIHERGELRLSPSVAAAVPTSSSLMPAHFVAQYTTSCSFEIATMLPASTSRLRSEQPVPVLHEMRRFAPRHGSPRQYPAGERCVPPAVLAILLRETVRVDVSGAAR